MEAFLRLKREGAFTEDRDQVHIRWYWYHVGRGYKIMAQRNLDNSGVSTLFREFFVSDSPLVPPRYF